MRDHNYKEIVDALLNGDDTDYYIQYIKQVNFSDDERIGLKNFLEDNNYDLNALKHFLKTPDLNPPLSKKNQNSYFKFAAGFVLIILSMLPFRFVFFPEKSISQFYIEDEGFKVRMSSEGHNQHLNDGMSHYLINKYQQALIEFDKVIDSDTAFYYSGLCYMKIKKFQNAVDAFERISVSSDYHNKSRYYLAFAYLMLEEETVGLEILQNNEFEDIHVEVMKLRILKEYTK
jgi:tetratricopeptide (TPR) repeat protein